MHFVPLLGQPLKSDALIEILESWDMEVIYAFDRLHENLPDTYHATAQQEGIEFHFDENQRLTTLFIHLIPSDTTETADLSDSDLIVFASTTEVASYAAKHSIKVTQGRAILFDIERDWIRLEFGSHSIHYEFQDGALAQITLSL